MLFSLLRLWGITQCSYCFGNIFALFHPRRLKALEFLAVAGSFQVVHAVICIIGQMRLLVHAPGMFGNHEEFAAEDIETWVVRCDLTRFQPMSSQAGEFLELADLIWVCADAVNPRITQFLCYDR